MLFNLKNIDVDYSPLSISNYNDIVSNKALFYYIYYYYFRLRLRNPNFVIIKIDKADFFKLFFKLKD